VRQHVARRKGQSGRISVFKGREARLNRAIFHILALKGPLTIYEVCKEVRTQKGLKQTRYTNVNRRIRNLEQSGCLEKAGTRKTQAGFQATLYQLTPRAYLAFLLNQINLDNFIQTADEDAIIATLAALMLHTTTMRRRI
jgi:predicted transcriptional regulator